MHLKEMHKILSGESKCMLGIYLSGTGNTKYCVTKLVKLIDASADVVPLEDEFIIDKIKRNETVVSYRITCNNGNQRTLRNP